MLSRISNQSSTSFQAATLTNSDEKFQRNEIEKFQRNEMEDLCKAIEYLYEFKYKLSKLHPHILDVIENMLQRPRY
jgi:hypothetical protein